MANSQHRLVLLAAALALTAVVNTAAAAAPAPADSPEARGKQLALIHLLVKAGKADEAAAAMHKLYPKGPPYGGDLAIEYYDVVGNTESGWQEARDGLGKLAKADPYNMSYQVMYARQLGRRAATRPQALKLFAELAARPKVNRSPVLDGWREAISRIDDNQARIAACKDYLVADPGNASVQDMLDGAERSLASQLPWKLRDQADAQLAAGHPDEAMKTLKRALKLDPRNAWVRFDLARLSRKQVGEKAGSDMMEEGLRIAPHEADTLYAAALYYGLLDEADHALRLLNQVPPRQRSPALVKYRNKMMVLSATQRAQEYSRAGKKAPMRSAMRRAQQLAGNDPEAVSIVANAWVDLGDAGRGVGMMREFSERPGATTDTRILYAKVLNRAERNDELQAVLESLSGVNNLTPGNREDLRYLRSSLASHRADDMRQHGKVDEARAVLKDALKSDPQDPDMLMALARVYEAAGERGQARAVYQGILSRDPDHAGAKQALQALAEREASEKARRAAASPTEIGKGYVATGIDLLNKFNGAGGISNMVAIELPVEARIPVGQSGGRLFLQVDPVHISAGKLNPADTYNLNQYGTLQLHPGAVTTPLEQSANGKAIAVGYDMHDWRFDIGSSPIGFLVVNTLGGVKYSHYTADTGFSLDVSRRPMTSTLLSYAGARDPATGLVWGGVVKSGVGMHLSHDWGRLSLFLDPGYYRLTGQNVLANSEKSVRTGFNWNFIDREDMRLTSGLTFVWWDFKENLRYYTFGQGGYYSPQKYESLHLPVRLIGRMENTSYSLEASVLASASYEKDMPYFPTDGNLQTSSGNLMYTGGPGHGTGFSLGGAVEHRFTPRLFAGLAAEIDRSAYYTPNYALIYLRYSFDPVTGPEPFPPDPVQAYSRY